MNRYREDEHDVALIQERKKVKKLTKERRKGKVIEKSVEQMVSKKKFVIPRKKKTKGIVV